MAADIVSQNPILTTRYGPMRAFDPDVDMIGGFLARYGEWAWAETVFIASVLDEGARVLDAGAFLGTFGLGVAQQRQLDLLLCVEANPDAVPLLRDNLAACAPCPARVEEALLAGPAPVAATRQVMAGNRGATAFRSEPGGDRDGWSTTLAALRERHGPFDLIKLDIEGMEREALLGDAAHLARGTTALWVECNEDVRSLAVAELLLSWGLALHYFAFPSHNPDNANGEPDPVFPWAFEAGLLAAPRRAPVLSDWLAGLGCILRPIDGVEALRDAMWRTPRWGMAEWTAARTAPELAALAGRTLREERRESFLTPGTEARPTLWDRIATLEHACAEGAAALAQAEEHGRIAAEYADRRQRQLTAEQAVRAALTERLAHADRMLADATALRAGLERRLAETSARALATLAAAGAARDEAYAATSERDRVLTELREDHARLLEEHRSQGRRLGDERQRGMAAAARIEAMQAELLRQDRRAREAEDAMRVIQSSTAWRLTGPARRVLHGLRRMRRGGGDAG